MAPFSIKKFKKSTFEQGHNTILAINVEPGMILALTKNKYFYVDDLEPEFASNEIAKLYEDISDEACIELSINHPEHTVLTFYDEDENEITNIPGDAKVIAFQRIDGPEQPVKPIVAKI